MNDLLFGSHLVGVFCFGHRPGSSQVFPGRSRLSHIVPCRPRLSQVTHWCPGLKPQHVIDNTLKHTSTQIVLKSRASICRQRLSKKDRHRSDPGISMAQGHVARNGAFASLLWRASHSTRVTKSSFCCKTRACALTCFFALR